MSWIAAASVAVGAYSANRANAAARDGAEAQQAGLDAATGEQRRQYDQTRQDQMPWLTAGTGALGQMQQLNNGDFSSFQKSPDYQFAFDQGMQGLDRGAAARGGLYSGGADADRIAYGQGMASQQYGQYYNRLASMAGVGQTTASGLGSMGMGMANQIGGNMREAGDARATAYGQVAGNNANFLSGAMGQVQRSYQNNSQANGGGSGWYMGSQPGKG